MLSHAFISPSDMFPSLQSDLVLSLSFPSVCVPLFLSLLSLFDVYFTSRECMLQFGPPFSLLVSPSSLWKVSLFSLRLFDKMLFSSFGMPFSVFYSFVFSLLSISTTHYHCSAVCLSVCLSLSVSISHFPPKFLFISLAVQCPLIPPPLFISFVVFLSDLFA